MKPTSDFFMRWARDIATRSTCAKIQVGAVIFKDGQLISAGYNGVPSGHQHCCNYFQGKEFPSQEEFLIEHAKFSEREEIHAEANALLSAWKHHYSVEGAELACTYSPCYACNKLIIQAGIKKVYYLHLYKQEAVDYLSKYVEVEQL